MVVDRTPMTRGGDDVKALVEQTLSRVGPVTVRRLPDQKGTVDDLHEPFHAKIEWAQDLASDVRNFGAIVSVGSGSITDVTKYARHLAREADPALPTSMICMPTAASVTAYSSALAVLTVDGVKRTLPARAPDAVVCDLRTIVDAPRAMTRAGFGDTLARSVAYGDWYLASELGMDEGFSTVPARLLGHAEQEMIDQAEQAGRGDPTAVRTVLNGLLLAGMAMSIMNQTAPVSGWEHVISHFLDLTAASDEREQALHGEQVGVGTLVAARAYDRAWNTMDCDTVLNDADPARYRNAVDAAFGRFDPTGAMITEIWRDLEKKMAQWNEAGEARRRFAARKRAGELDAFMQRHVRPAVAVHEALKQAGAPLRFADLTRPVPASTARAAVGGSHLIRARFTLGDLLWHTGWLAEPTIEDLLRDTL
jgi:glycerol-1-phosphate dehydrogenase [NAD(P)+]